MVSPPKETPQTLLGPIAQVALLLSTAVLLALPSLDWAWAIDPTPAPQENRVLAKDPATPASLEQLAKWPALFEAWFKDHFGLRNSLIAWHSSLMLDVLGVSPSKDVLIGKDGWLFLGATKNVDAYRCLAPYTPDELKIQVAEAKRRQAWLAKRGIRYGHVWVPIKANIYPEFLPDGLKKLDQPCRLPQWIDAVGKAGVPVLDLTQALAEAKKNTSERLYYKTDTHWNPRGAWAGYQAMAPWLKGLAPEARILTDAEVGFRMLRNLGGDLARLLDLPERYAAVDPFLSFKIQLGREVAPQVKAPKGVNLRAFDCPGCGKLRAVLLHDSFGNHLRPYLAETFGHMLAAEFSAFDEALLEAEHPNLVLEVHLERQLTPDR